MSRIIEDLLLIMKQRETVEFDENTDTAMAMMAVMDAVIDDSCAYVSNE